VIKYAQTLRKNKNTQQFDSSPLGNVQSKIQIVTMGELLEGKKIEMLYNERAHG
jgi:hypothetical protein